MMGSNSTSSSAPVVAMDYDELKSSLQKYADPLVGQEMAIIMPSLLNTPEPEPVTVPVTPVYVSGKIQVPMIMLSGMMTSFVNQFADQVRLGVSISDLSITTTPPEAVTSSNSSPVFVKPKAKSSSSSPAAAPTTPVAPVTATSPTYTDDQLLDMLLATELHEKRAAQMAIVTDTSSSPADHESAVTSVIAIDQEIMETQKYILRDLCLRKDVHRPRESDATDKMPDFPAKFDKSELLTENRQVSRCRRYITKIKGSEELELAQRVMLRQQKVAIDLRRLVGLLSEANTAEEIQRIKVDFGLDKKAAAKEARRKRPKETSEKTKETDDDNNTTSASGDPTSSTSPTVIDPVTAPYRKMLADMNGIKVATKLKTKRTLTYVPAVAPLPTEIANLRDSQEEAQRQDNSDDDVVPTDEDSEPKTKKSKTN